MKVGMVDIDLLDHGTRFPNLAQMKMSAYCKEQGHDVTLLYRSEDLGSMDRYDVLLVSKVFSSSKVPDRLQALMDELGSLKDLNAMSVGETLENGGRNGVSVQIGGTGFFEDGGRRLDPSIERHFPDYDLYQPYVDYMVEAKGRKRSYFSDYTDCFIGFTTRGCPRRCGFCVVRFDPYCRLQSSPRELVDATAKGRKRILLWDDNILAHPDCIRILDELNGLGMRFQFRQGLDIRLMTPEKARRLASSRYYGDFIFAFDNWKDRDMILEKLRIWREAQRERERETKFYLLTGYGARCVSDASGYISEGETVDEKDRIDILQTFLRIRVMLENSCLPYIMRYEDYKKSRYRGMYVQLARWCNQPALIKKLSFRQFVDLNLKHVKGDDCAASRALRTFLDDCPDFPQELLDMKWSDYRSRTSRPPRIDQQG